MFRIKPPELALWIIPKKSPIKRISIKEEEILKNLSINRSKEFVHSRGYVREFLSQILSFEPLDIPLSSLPGKPPKLPINMGFLSFSHCQDALFVAWSKNNIGTDIEKKDRNINPNKLKDLICNQEEIALFEKLEGEKKREFILELWVIKEASLKWQKGKLYQDISQWHFYPQNNICIHDSSKNTVKILKLTYKYWHIAIAIDQNIDIKLPIICDAENY